MALHRGRNGTSLLQKYQLINRSTLGNGNDYPYYFIG